MRFFLFVALVLVTFSAVAQDIRLNDYHWNVNDVAARGLNKETLFTKMDRHFIKVGKSICSNRALMWSNDFKRQYNLDTAKIFLFFTAEANDDRRLRVWWYHVAPVINERGHFWVMDPAFGGPNDRPLTKEGWFQDVTGYSRCREIQGHETELVQLMFREKTFPKVTSYGRHDCYYKIVPHTMWNPNVVVQNLLGVDATGRPVRVERPYIDKNELYQACVEATAGKIGWALGSNKKQCKEYVGY